MRVAILGANGHLSKCALWSFAQKRENKIYLFSRNPNEINCMQFSEYPCQEISVHSYEEFHTQEYDVIFNGVGSWDARELEPKYIFRVTEQYDNLILDYQMAHTNTVSIHISSGAVYAGDYMQAVDDRSEARIRLNHIQVGDYYSIAKINSEAKHRAFSELNIVDIRLFGFFSRFMSLDYPYFLSAIINAIRNGTEFSAVNGEFWRDYIHLNDFAALCHNIAETAGHQTINTAIDVVSKEPISKDDMLTFFRQTYGLKLVHQQDNVEISRTGLKPYYYSRRKNEIYTPRYTSLETLKQELKYFL